MGCPRMVVVLCRLSKAVQDVAARLAGKGDFEGIAEPAVLALWLMPDPKSLPKRVFKTAEGNDKAPQPVQGLEDPEVKPLRFAYADLLAQSARTSLDFVLNYGVLPADAHAKSDRNVEQLQNQKILVLRDRPADGKTFRDELPLIQVPGPKEALEFLSTRTAQAVAAAAEKAAAPGVETAALQSAAFALAKAGLVDTLRLDLVATKGAREAARAAVPPVMKTISMYEIIQRAGTAWTTQSLSDVHAYLAEKQRRRGSATSVVPTTIASMIFAGLALGCLVRAMTILHSRRRRNPRGLYVSINRRRPSRGRRWASRCR